MALPSEIARRRAPRFAAAIGVLVAHGALLFLLLQSVISIVAPPRNAVELINIAAPPPVPKAPKPAAPAAARVVPPLPARAQSAPIPVAAPSSDAEPTPPTIDAGRGTDARQGNGNADSGGGISGSGVGITRARWQSGTITNRDYPKAANQAGIGGSVTVNFDVRADGGVEHCRVVVSTGSALLDRTTCALIEQRFRYEPARDTHGDAISDVAGWRQDWWLAPPR